jgi:hypothetical protein
MNVGFYVSAMDGSKPFLMFGPLDTKDDADGKVDGVKDKALKLDGSGRAWFMAWGVTKVTTPNALPVGRLNKMVGVQ